MSSEKIKEDQTFADFDEFDASFTVYRTEKGIIVKGRSTKPLRQKDLDSGYKKELKFKELIYVCDTWERNKR